MLRARQVATWQLAKRRVAPWRCARAWCRPCSSEATGERPAPAPAPVLLFRARSLENESRSVENAITFATVGMSGGMGFAFLGLAPLTSPNLFMIGLLLAIFQVQFGYSLITRQLYMQRRRWVMELYRDEDKHLVTVVCDANLKRVWTLGNDAATGDTPSMQDIAEKGKMFFYLDREVGEVMDAEGLDALLADSKGIEEEKVEVKPVIGETEELSKRIVQSFSELTRTNLQQMAGKDGGSPIQQLDVLERAAKITGVSFMTMGLLFYVMGNWSAQNAIHRAAQSYTPSPASHASPAKAT
ncbi:unnamed protein product [Cladocopium goreaui]|uniref:PNPLA domain-containing protein n=1 Tax=Cladocopium goreaui TaxID=2562237 RepID=A0A9P1DME9_9DINO|nr:unnamed protein product [Cladocopium goreaui]